MVVDDELKKTLEELRALGVKRIVFREDVYAPPLEVEFFEPAADPFTGFGAEEEEQPDEPELPLGFQNAADVLRRRKAS